MSKHTPGKWFLNTNLTQILNEDGHTIANVSPMGARTAEERDANARILHAAPEMYEALRAIAMCGFKREDGETWCKCSPNDYDLERAHALLAKIDATNSPEQGKGG